MPADPLIITLTLDEATQARFDRLRAENFPASRLLVGAHVTMFHALPGEGAGAIAALLGSEAAAISPFPVTVSSVRFLGRGVAYALQSAELAALRERLRGAWIDVLTAQDRQRWQPHVTIQNKANPNTARDLHSRLSSNFVPYEVTATGLALWHYRGGPWEAAGTFLFPVPEHRQPRASPADF